MKDYLVRNFKGIDFKTHKSTKHFIVITGDIMNFYAIGNPSNNMLYHLGGKLQVHERVMFVEVGVDQPQENVQDIGLAGYEDVEQPAQVLKEAPVEVVAERV